MEHIHAGKTFMYISQKEGEGGRGGGEEEEDKDDNDGDDSAIVTLWVSWRTLS